MLSLNQCDFKFIEEVIKSNIHQSTETVTDKDEAGKPSSFLQSPSNPGLTAWCV